MAAGIEDVLGSLKDALNLVLSKPALVLSDLAKVAALEIVLSYAFAICVSLASMMIGGAGALSGSLPLALILVLVFFIPFVVLSAALGATPYRLFDGRAKGGSAGAIKSFSGLIIPMGKYALLTASALIVVVGGAALLALFLASINPWIAAIVALAAFALLIFFVFAVQFAPLEVALSGAGPFEAIRRSYSLATGNLLAVILFDILMVIAGLGVGFAMIFVSMPGGMLNLVPGVGFIAAMAYSAIVTVIGSVISMLFTLTPNYFFWRRLTGAPPQKKAGLEAPKAQEPKTPVTQALPADKPEAKAPKAVRKKRKG
ncbi:MAG: hypothetical protein V1827_01755 [Candidatus Micrarchaeota archaeon]